MIKDLAHALRTLVTEHDRTNNPASSLPEELHNRLGHTRRDDLSLMPSKGLAHDHISINGTDLLLRVPKQSQMGFSAADNLRYQHCCFSRMHPSGHTPACHGLLPPSSALPMGALLVQRIHGRQAKCDADFERIALALASIHSLPIPQDKAPLVDQSDPMGDTLREVEQQARFLERSAISSASRTAIKQELAHARRDVDSLPPAPARLITFDAHPGNFLIDSSGKAIMVDLEKARYGGCGFDLAHASLYTSTTWDVDINLPLSSATIEAFYLSWSQHVPASLSSSMQAYLVPMRRLMWLWSVTWCAMWLVESTAAARDRKQDLEDTRDWAASNNPDNLISHVRERVTHYLQADVIDRIRAEFK